MKRKNYISSSNNQMKIDKNPTRLVAKSKPTYMKLSIKGPGTAHREPINIDLSVVNENDALQIAANWIYKNSPLGIKTPQPSFVRNVLGKYKTLDMFNKDGLVQLVKVQFSIETLTVGG